jgi:pimeloyl-ACP methyl ester carboxylesterase
LFLRITAQLQAIHKIHMLNLILLSITTLYQTIAILLENQQQPPGQLIDVGGYKLHLCTLGSGDITFVVDHSLGGVEGYVLIDELAKLGRVCIYDRAGFGWSDRSPHSRTSGQIVQELDRLLTQAQIAPPYILIGNSFGTYNMRLYAHHFPEKVKGMVLTDGLHESGMLKMSLPVKGLKMLFVSGFLMSVVGAGLGIIRLLKTCFVFELLKPELRRVKPAALNAMKRSFCRPKHWITMTLEILDLDASGRQLETANDFGDLPIVNIKARSLFHPKWWTVFVPLRSANHLRDRMHEQLAKLSTRCSQISADRSGHFVWIDQPELIVEAAKRVLNLAQEP